MARKAAPKARKAPAKQAKAKAASKTRAKSAPAQPAKQPPKKVTALRNKMSKAAMLTHLAQETGLTRVQVASVMSELEILIERHIKKRAVGEFSLLGLMKIRSVKRPATKQRMGRNPATGEEVVVPAKPATTRVRITALKRLKEMAL